MIVGGVKKLAGQTPEAQRKGVIELLDNVFGGAKLNSVTGSDKLSGINIITGFKKANGKNGYGLDYIKDKHADVVPFIKEAIKKAELVEELPDRNIFEATISDGRKIRLIVDEKLGGKKNRFLNNAYFIK